MNTIAAPLTTVELLEALRNDPAARAAIASLYTKAKNADRDAEIAHKVWAGAKHSDVAVEYGLSVNRITQIMSTRPNPNPEKRNPNAERDRLILDAARRKVPRAEIARQHNLSVIRVNQIVGAAPKASKVTLTERIERSIKRYDAFDELTFDDECNILISKYDGIARQIIQDMLDGMGQAQLSAKYPTDMTGGDIAWDNRHYGALFTLYYNPQTGNWDK
jgi:hypothetical protein